MLPYFYKHQSAKQGRHLSVICASSNTPQNARTARQFTSYLANVLTVQMGTWRLLKVAHLVGGKERAATLVCSRRVG